MRAGFHEGGPNGGVENNADLFYSASELYNPKDSCTSTSKVYFQDASTY